VRTRIISAALAALAATLLTAAPAAADATYSVTPGGSGVACSTASPCSLATALSEAASASGAAVTVNLASGTYGAFTVDGGDETSLTLVGVGAPTTTITASGSGKTALIEAEDFPVTISDLTLTDGDATGTDGGDLEIDSSSPSTETTLTDDAITGGTTSENGGGIAIDQGAVTISGSEISGNSSGSGERGGGLMIQGGSAKLEDSAVVDNTAAGGAGIDVNSSTTLELLDSTLAGNVGDGLLSAGTSSVYGSTIAYNSTGGIDIEAGSTDLGASVLASNDNADCFAGTPVDEGDNYTDDSSCTLPESSSHGDDGGLSVAAPALNGGSTDTAALGAASAGYDSIPLAATIPDDPESGAFCAGSDQRGVPRSEGPASGCSAGAFQFSPPVIASLSPRSALELGLAVTISGYGFGDVTSARFGTLAATITSQTNTSIALDVPLALSLGSQPITLANADGSASTAFSAVASPTVGSLILSPGQLKVPYSQQIAVAGGASPFSFTQLAGALPAGLSLSSTGVVSGTPTKAGGSAFAVEVSDANGFTSPPLNVSLAIATPVVSLTTHSIVLAGTSASVTLACAGAPCAGTVTLTAAVVKKIHGRPKGVTEVLASGAYTDAVGQPATVELALTPDGVHLLKHAHKHPLSETLHASVAAGTTASRTVRVS
jgi:hypothetical protein